MRRSHALFSWLSVTLASLLLPLAVSAAQLVDVIEYRNAALDHYFITAEPAEIAALDAGALGGAWRRTGVSFIAWQIGEPPPGGAQATCRFFGTDRYRVNGSRIGPNSHFYTAIPSECAYVKTAWPAVADDGQSYPAWSFESLAFYIKLPSADGCAAGTTPIYRMYNNAAGGEPNHRISPTFDGMSFQGANAWVHEGVVMCAPQRVPAYETEPNGNTVEANVMSFPGELRGFLASTGDEDWFAFDVTTPDQIVSASFSIMGTSSALWGVTWIGPKSNYGELTVLSGRNLSAETFDYTFPAFHLGRYYLKVAPVAGPAFLFDTKTYVMRASIAPYRP